MNLPPYFTNGLGQYHKEEGEKVLIVSKHMIWQGDTKQADLFDIKEITKEEFLEKYNNAETNLRKIAEG